MMKEKGVQRPELEKVCVCMYVRERQRWSFVLQKEIETENLSTALRLARWSFSLMKDWFLGGSRQMNWKCLPATHI